MITEECTRNGTGPGISAPPVRRALRRRHRRGQATLENMPLPSRRLKELTEGTVDHHASLTHPDLQEITIRWRGSFVCLDAWAGDGDDSDERTPLRRIEYPGDDDDWAFAIYDPATETYPDALLRTEHPDRPPERRLRHRRHHPPRRLPEVTIKPARRQ